MSSYLSLDRLKTHFPIYRGLFGGKPTGFVRAVDGISLDLRRGEILGLVGESGCGKSTLARTIMHLVRPTEGRISLDGRCLTGLSRREIRNVRLEFQMIFQDPYASLNPRMTVFSALAEAVRARHKLNGEHLRQRVIDLMTQVGLEARQMLRYPHEFSGGQRQRIAIARALAPEPKLLIADEPVSALDVSIQSQILNLIRRLCREMNLTLIFISHDIAVVRYISDRIAVMYLGKIVELGMATEVLENPLHPYTRALVSAVPVPDPLREKKRQRIILTGDPPSPITPPEGCHFHPRCPYAIEECALKIPRLDVHRTDHQAACFRIGAI